MLAFGVQLALEEVREAKRKFAKAQREFNSDVEFVMARLLNEAAANRLSAEKVARWSGFTVKRIRMMMREQGLNPKMGINLLEKTASENLLANAALMGIEPHEMDLRSPLAYLPMGSQLKAFLETQETEACPTCGRKADAS